LRHPLPEPSGTLLGGANLARPTDRHKRDGDKLDGGSCPSPSRRPGHRPRWAVFNPHRLCLTLVKLAPTCW